jgi:hypothetical protein
MKKIIFTVLFLIVTLSIQAQDTIVKINGDKILAKILEVSSSTIKFQKISNLTGPTYSLSIDELKEILYENGVVEVFEKDIKVTSEQTTLNDATTIKNNENAQVYFIRSTGFAGSMSAFTAFIDQELVCRLNNKKYSIHEVSPGEHYFTVQFAGNKAKNKAEPILINVEAGKTYYIQMVFQTGAFKNNLYCQEVTENSANTILIECEKDLKCL